MLYSETAFQRQQREAYDAVMKWYKNKNAPQIFRVFGYGGTGKTLLASKITESIKGVTIFLAHTGKAVMELRKRGCDAHTICSKTYVPIVDGESVRFVFNEESELASASLLVVDECSMVDEAMALDVLSFGGKVLVLGDGFQLPSFDGTGYFTNAKPDVMMTEIGRQALDSPIIRLSMEVREGRPLKQGAYGDCYVIQQSSLNQDWFAEEIVNASQMLCGKNDTRVFFNKTIRNLKGKTSLYPEEGDKLLCLRNNKEKGLYNGALWDCMKSRVFKDTLGLVASTEEEYVREQKMRIHKSCFDPSIPAPHFSAQKSLDAFTYGNCLTVHKSQGSSFPHVVLFDESRAFREYHRQHLYTGITRASEKITIIIP